MTTQGASRDGHLRPVAWALRERRVTPYNGGIGRVFAEHAMVRVMRDCKVEGHRLARDSVDAVVAIYNRGEVYAVELQDTAGATAVVTLRPADPAEVSVQ